MTRRQRRRDRISSVIEFYLRVVQNGEWTENNDIIAHLDYTSRGRRSYNSLTVNALGQYLRFIPGVERRERFRDGNGRSTQYRIPRSEEE